MIKLYRSTICALNGKNTCQNILGGRQHRTTPAGQILGVATPATSSALTPMRVHL